MSIVLGRARPDSSAARSPRIDPLLEGLALLEPPFKPVVTPWDTLTLSRRPGPITIQPHPYPPGKPARVRAALLVALDAMAMLVPGAGLVALPFDLAEKKLARRQGLTEREKGHNAELIGDACNIAATVLGVLGLAVAPGLLGAVIPLLLLGAYLKGAGVFSIYFGTP